jgi:hypothetical protein
MPGDAGVKTAGVGVKAKGLDSKAQGDGAMSSGDDLMLCRIETYLLGIGSIAYYFKATAYWNGTNPDRNTPIL